MEATLPKEALPTFLMDLVTLNFCVAIKLSNMMRMAMLTSSSFT